MWTDIRTNRARVQWLRHWISHPTLIQGSGVLNHWLAPRSTQPFIFPRLIKWVPGISRNLLVKSKLPPHSCSVALRQLNPIHKKGVTKYFLFKITLKTLWLESESPLPKTDVIIRITLKESNLCVML